MPTDPHAAVRAAALELVRLLAELPAVPPVRVAEAGGGGACLIQVWAAGTAMPTVAGERRATPPARRDGGRRDIVEAVRKAGRPLTPWAGEGEGGARADAVPATRRLAAAV